MYDRTGDASDASGQARVRTLALGFHPGEGVDQGDGIGAGILGSLGKRSDVGHIRSQLGNQRPPADPPRRRRHLGQQSQVAAEDHAAALLAVLQRGRVGETYNIGGDAERRNIDIVRRICSLLDRYRPRADGKPHSGAIEFVTDRPGHDFRYAIDSSKLQRELGWRPETGFDTGLEATLRWYLENEAWWNAGFGGTELKRIGTGDVA